MRDFRTVRGIAHKFKGSFRLICSKLIGDSCEKLQFLIDKGNILETNDEYLQVVSNILVYLNAIIELANKLNNPVNQDSLQKFWDLNSLCNEFENINNKKVLTHEQLDLDEWTIRNKNSACCSGINCNIY